MPSLEIDMILAVTIIFITGIALDKILELEERN